MREFFDKFKDKKGFKDSIANEYEQILGGITNTDLHKIRLKADLESQPFNRYIDILPCKCIELIV